MRTTEKIKEYNAARKRKNYYSKKPMSQDERIYIFERMGDFNMSGEDNSLIIKLRKEYKEIKNEH